MVSDRNILNDEKVLVTCGNTSGNMDIYDIATDTFATMTGDTKHFPNLYPRPAPTAQ